MEKEGMECLAKIMNGKKEFFISDKVILIGRSFNVNLNNEVTAYLKSQNLQELINQGKKINLGDDQKMSRVAGLIIYHEKKKIFGYTNLSNNLQVVNNKFLDKFQTIKLKNKSPIVIGNELFFFIYSKSLLKTYYQKRIEKLCKRRQKNQDSSLSNLHQTGAKISPTTGIKSEAELHHNKLSLSAKSQFKAKKSFKKQKTEEENNNTNLKYSFDSILKLPNNIKLHINENENILDDLIEEPSK